MPDDGGPPPLISFFPLPLPSPFFFHMLPLPGAYGRGFCCPGAHIRGRRLEGANEDICYGMMGAEEYDLEGAVVLPPFFFHPTFSSILLFSALSLSRGRFQRCWRAMTKSGDVRAGNRFFVSPYPSCSFFFFPSLKRILGCLCCKDLPISRS